LPETECKVAVPDLAPLARRLAALGAGRLGGGPERNTVYDTPDGRLAARGSVLRIRRWPGKPGGLLTVKALPAPNPSGEASGGGGPDRFKVREEHETRVDDPEATARALEALGYVAADTYGKDREEWALDGQRVALDRLEGLGSFVEVEGDREGIGRVLAALGLDPARHISENYLALLRGAQGRLPCPPP